MAHARLGPSNHRWPHCPGSVREESGYEDVAGSAAIDGTGSHELLELCLVNGVRAEAYDGQIIGANHPDNPNGWLVGPERIERVQMCLDYVTRRYNELSAQYPDCQIVIESESHSNPGSIFNRDDWWGTVDITIRVMKGDECLFLEICDYKDGRGWVNAKDNSQLLSYAGGKLKEYIDCEMPRPMFQPYQVKGVQKVRTSIVQPKTSPVIRYEDYEPSTVLSKVDQLAKAAEATDDPNAPLIAGKHCQWCKANQKRGGHCSIESENSLNMVKSMTNDVIVSDSTPLFELLSQATSDVTTLDSDKLSQLADARAGMNAIFDKIESEIERRIESGERVKGYAIKPGRSTKVWAVSEEEVEKALKGRRLTKDDIWPRSLISPAQAVKHEKLTDKQRQAIVEKLITEKAGKLKLTKVAHGDEQTVEEMFKDVSEPVAQSVDDVLQSAPSVFNDTVEPEQPISFL